MMVSRINRQMPFGECALVRVILLFSALLSPLIALAAPPPTRALAPAPASLRARMIRPFDSDWRFVKGDTPGAEKPDFDDSAWRTLNLPHDWSIEGPFEEKNPTGASGGFLPAGIGWYRKTFTLPAEDALRRVWVEFDGVMANSDIYLNGVRVGGRPSGYVSFRCDLTGKVRVGPGQTNVLAVRCDNSGQPASRWYSGAGIYRHVRLVTSGSVHLLPDSIFVTTPKINDAVATVHVRGEVANDGATPAASAGLRITVLTADGRPLVAGVTQPKPVAAGQTAAFETDLPLPKPQRWDLEHPTLYRAYVEVRSDEATRDDVLVPFGIREFHFAPDTGFYLNGRNLKIKGVCLHQDASALGVAVPLSAWERRLTTLRGLGVNAIRTAHNPPSPDFLDLCDRMGFLVMDELFDCWTVGKRPFDYHLYFEQWSRQDTRDTALRDRNHPSIILYSIGNEIHDTPQAEKAKAILTGLRDTLHEADPTRPVTQALFRPNASHDYEDGLADLLDVVGQNYRETELVAAHKAKPTRKIIGTETTHDLRAWTIARDDPAFSGQFLWTGIDYLGEAGAWPFVGNGSGLLDRTGMPNPRGYQRQSWWDDRPVVSLVRRTARSLASPTDPGYEAFNARRDSPTQFADWSPRNSDPHEETVEAYSNCDSVELFLNAKSLGALPRPKDNASPRVWKVPFAPGTLRAIASNAGRPVAFHELQTADAPVRIALVPERGSLSSDSEDVVYVRAEVVDAKGIRVPNAADEITFTLSGPGQIVATDSADNRSHESFASPTRRAYQGRCFVIVRATASTGEIALTASAPNLGAGSAHLIATPPSRP